MKNGAGEKTVNKKISRMHPTQNNEFSFDEEKNQANIITLVFGTPGPL